MTNRISALLLFLIFSLISVSLQAQKRYWVFLSDKDGVTFNPEEYFDSAVIRKMAERNVSLTDFSNLPLRADYLSEIKKITANTGLCSRWFNAVSVNIGDTELQKIKALPFVKDVEEITMVSVTASAEFDSDISYDIDELRKQQINEFGIKNFEERGIDGSGVRIAVFDGGFPGVDTSPMFQHIRDSGRIIKTWDFVKNKEFVYDYNSHGTSVLTCITGILDDNKFGLATGAEFLLARTEVTREVFSEEENWLAAMEWAYQNGADIISSSLGYTERRYFPKQMDGHYTLVTRAANMAASKGILVINAAGNDGDKKWEVIGAPADADSILSIGGVSPDNGYHINFSSFGPTYDGRMKPNLVAFGKVATSNQKKVVQSFGTSFATPLVSGFAACVIQMHPEWDKRTVFEELQKSGHLYPYFDYAHGYGVPQASYFTSDKKIVNPTFSFEYSDEYLAINVIDNSSDDEVDTTYVVSEYEDDYDYSDASDDYYEYETDTLDESYQDYYEADSIYDSDQDYYVADSVDIDYDSLFTEADSLDYTAVAEVDFDFPEIDIDSIDYSSWDEDTNFSEDFNEADYEDYFSEENFTDGYDLDKNIMYLKINPADETKISRYILINMAYSDSYKLPVSEFNTGDIITVHFRGYTASFDTLNDI